MKRIISFLLVALMLISSVGFFPEAAKVEAAVASGVKGDIDGDEVVSVKDMLKVRKMISGALELPEEDIHIVDFDEDEDLTAKDIRYMKMYLVGAIESLEDVGDLEDKPIVTIAGNDLQNYVIIFPDEWKDEGWSVDAEDGYYGASGDRPNGGVNPVHYAARSMRVFIGGFCHVGFGANNIKTTSQATNDQYRIELIVDETTYGEDGFNIKVENGNVYIRASSKRGMIYGTTEFMEKYLQGKFFANGSGNYDDAPNAFDIPNGIDDTQKPGFEYRAMVGYSKNIAGDNTGVYAAHNYTSRRKINGYGTTDTSGLNHYTYGYSIGRIGQFNAHSIYAYCNPNPAYNGTNDMFLDNSKAATPCLSSTDPNDPNSTFSKVIASLKADIAAHQGDFDKRLGLNRQLLQISCSMQDHNTVCDCQTCMGKYRTYGCFNAVYFEFLNKVADYFYDIYGDELKIFSILYDRTYPEAFFAASPDNLPRSNMVLCYCSSACNNHTLDGAGCVGKTPSPVTKVESVKPNIEYYENGTGNSIGELERISKFGALSNSLEAQNGEAFDFYVWYYPTNVHFYVCPTPNYFNILKDMRLLADAGVDGIYFESDTADYAFEGMRDFLAAEAMWNPYMSQAEYEELMDKWLEKYCGDGWRYIKKYLLMNEAATDGVGCFVNNYDYPWTMVSKSYYAENYETMKDLFSSAYKFAKKDRQKDFILRARVHCDFLGLSALWSQKNNYGWYWEEYNRMYDYLTSPSNVTYYAKGSSKVSHGYFALGGENKQVGAYGVNPMVWLGLSADY
ncbi:MAG: DUF4838 domain-containing protein [Ruminococcaceae bacterium]|nr:DUF4838 domain-containing protein [Oscillospiraceae bacterium]